MSEKKKKSLLTWIFTFAGEKKPAYFASIFFALLKVTCGIAPYILIASIVQELLSGVRDWNLYLRQCAIIALFWAGNAFFHMISTTLSHVAPASRHSLYRLFPHRHDGHHRLLTVAGGQKLLDSPEPSPVHADGVPGQNAVQYGADGALHGLCHLVPVSVGPRQRSPYGAVSAAGAGAVCLLHRLG
ncbi:MAG: hypothetical protein SPL22_01190, partial [Treponema sp.]|nr:hypothetical protein [Treponema sp.]